MSTMSAGGLTASSSVAVTGTYPPQGVGTTLDNTIISQKANNSVTPITYGTTSGKANLITCSVRTINATTAVTYDLYTGTDLKDLDGQTCAFRGIKFIQVSIVSGGDATGVRIGGAAANTWVAFFADVSDKCLIFPGGPAYQGGSPAGIVVGVATKNFKIENLGAVAVNVEVVAVGTDV